MHAQPSATSQANLSANGTLDSGDIAQDPLRGLIVNRTMTVLGWDFYTNFASVWSTVQPDSKYTLTVTERPTAQYGSEIWIDYRGNTLFHTFLSPARAKVADASKQAASIVEQNLQQIEQQRQLFQNGDLAPEEFE